MDGRRLVVSCDGTWNSPSESVVGTPVPTNVFRFHNCLARTDGDGRPQLRRYQAGVGTRGGRVRRYLEGVLGLGVDEEIVAAYHWLALTYRPGDDVSVLGFSRGAYTARSLVGMVMRCGLVDLSGLTGAQGRALVTTAFTHYRHRDELSDDWAPLRRTPASERAAGSNAMGVTFLGVWDTVGSLGVPAGAGLLEQVNRLSDVGFHDTALHPGVRHARHAVALDETRGPFSPTLWEPSSIAGRTEGTVEQLWFPGNHRDVGGGHLRTGLSDGALIWMVEEARTSAGLEFDPDLVAQISPDPCDVLHDDCTGIYTALAPSPRPVPCVDDLAGPRVVHSSALTRRRHPLITTHPYRPTTRMVDDGDVEVRPVRADVTWNDTGLFLTEGTYRLEGAGTWTNAGTTYRVDGTLEDASLSTRFLATVDDVRRRVVPLSDLREPSAPRMALMGTVGQQDFVPGTGALAPRHHVRIGTGTTITVESPGYLHAWANDVRQDDGDNSGEVELTVRRLDEPHP